MDAQPALGGMMVRLGKISGSLSFLSPEAEVGQWMLTYDNLLGNKYEHVGLDHQRFLQRAPMGE